MATGVTSRDIVSLLDARARRFGRWPALRYRPTPGAPLQELSWADWFGQAQALAATLQALGFRPGDRAALFARSCPEWLVADMAVLMAGGVSVPLPSGGSTYGRRRMLHETRPRVVFAGDAGDVIRLRESWPTLDTRASLVVIEVPEGGTASLAPAFGGARPVSLDDALVRGRALLDRGDARHASDSGRDPHDPATIVYSAGRTGPPRGAVLSHQCLVSKLLSLREVVVLPRSAVQLLALPLCTIFGRLMAWAAVDQGATTWIATPRAPLAPQLAESRPHFFAGVPRIYERLRDLVLTRREGTVGSPGRATLLLAERFLQPGSKGRGRRGLAGLDERLARRMFRTRVRHLLGGRIQTLVCGGGLLDESVTRLFAFGGVPVLEGYGSNETVGAATANRLGRHRAGSVGEPLPDVELRLSPSGEILVRGEGLFLGYLRAVGEDGHLQVDSGRDAEGWFHTHDLGLVEEGHLYLTGREQDILRLAGGRSVAPSLAEGALTAQRGVLHAVLCGENEPHVTALLWTEPGLTEDLAAEAGGGEDLAALVEAHLRRAVQQVNQSLERHEQIRAFQWVERPLREELGELSSNGEPVRAVIYQRFRDVIDGMYPER